VVNEQLQRFRNTG